MLASVLLTLLHGFPHWEKLFFFDCRHLIVVVVIAGTKRRETD